MRIPFSVWQNLFILRTVAPKRKLSMDYSQWPKEDLIKRIQLLEKVQGRDVASSPKRPAKKKKEMDFSKYTTRKVAIRFGYLGWNYAGLAVQLQEGVETVENEILKALYKTRLIPSMEISECEFSRCGRTDRGVSALRQVVSLRVRSKLSVEDQANPEMDNQELDYLHMINNLLPNDIVLYEICLRPPEDFDARFSCQYRHYHYYFHADNLDVAAMSEAATYFLGEHDFRNFCKIDASKQITNFKRNVLISEIVRDADTQNMYYFSLRGTAFLWHQVRSMIAILLLVGQKLESPAVVAELLDISKYPGRPVYDMAADYPLVFYDCGFPDMEWKSFNRIESLETVKRHTFNLWHDYWMKQTITMRFRAMIEQNSRTNEDQEKTEQVFVNLGGGYGKTISTYPLLSTRERLDSPEVINARYLAKREVNINP